MKLKHLTDYELIKVLEIARIATLPDMRDQIGEQLDLSNTELEKLNHYLTEELK